jgi:hypothetical protein
MGLIDEDDDEAADGDLMDKVNDAEDDDVDMDALMAELDAAGDDETADADDMAAVEEILTAHLDAPAADDAMQPEAAAEGKKEKAKTEPRPLPPAPEISVDDETIRGPEDLKVHGLDGLKAALLARELKCGGTLDQRAERLWGWIAEERKKKEKAKGKKKKSKKADANPQL